jgi:RHS repeat-associated protein
MELEWDALGRLSRAREGEASVVGEYAYDAFDARMYKREGSRETFYFSDRYEVRDGIATVFLDLDSIRLSRLETASLAAQVLPDLAPLTGAGTDLEADGDGQIRAADAWVSQAITVGAVTLSGAVAGDVRTQLASSAHRLLLGESGEARSYYHQNHTGNVAAVTDDEGRVFERTEYYAEGQVRWSSGGGKVESYGYSGKEHDASGLLYFGARYLDPITGRWVSPDPTFINVDNAFPNWGEEATNPYSYALGNPVNNRDPDGRFVDNIVGAVVGAVGGALIAGIAEVIQQRNEVKSGSRAKISWKTVAVKAGISAAIGGAVGATGIGGWAALGVGLGIKAGSAAVTTTMKWRAEKNLGQSRQANTSLADKKRLEKRARWWHRAAIGTDVAVAAVGIGMGAADIVGLTTASHIFGQAAVGVVSAIVTADAVVSVSQAVYDGVTGHKADRARRAERHAAAAASQAVAQQSANTASDSDASSGTAVRPRSRASTIRPRAISRTRSQPALRVGAHRARSNSAPGR